VTSEIRSPQGRRASRIARVTERPDPWPLRHLVLRTPRLELRPDDDAGLLELVDLAHEGPRSFLDPFLHPWTDAPAAEIGPPSYGIRWVIRR